MSDDSDRAAAEAAQREIIENFALLQDWSERYQYLIDLGKQLEPLAESERCEQNLLHGCQSQVWVVAEGDAERMHFRANSDAAIVSGLIALMLKVYDGRGAATVLEVEPAFIRTIGLDRHLSSTRNNGLAALYGRLRAEAARAIS
jgi:cysteine desulfuration protein SufE